MVTLRALESFNYAGLDRSSGSSFEATVEDARILILIGKAEVLQPLPIESHVDDDGTAIQPRRLRGRHSQAIAE